MTEEFISMDGGVGYFAWAHWDPKRLPGERLLACAVYRPGKIPPPRVYHVVVEVPDRHWKGRQSDVYMTAFMSGVWGLKVASEEGVITPVSTSAWKGNIKKGDHHPQIEEALSSRERALLPVVKSVRGHVLDAVGIGLWWIRKSAARAEMERRSRL